METNKLNNIKGSTPLKSTILKVMGKVRIKSSFLDLLQIELEKLSKSFEAVNEINGNDTIQY